MGWQSEKGRSDKGNSRQADDSAQGGRFRDDRGGKDSKGEKGSRRGDWDRGDDKGSRRGDWDRGDDKGSRRGDWDRGDEKGSRRGDDKGSRKGDWNDRDRGDRKGGWSDGKGEKGDRKGDKGKGKGSRPEKVISQGIRGTVVTLLKDKPSGFIERRDREKDVFFDLADLAEGEQVELNDPVEFDIIERYDAKLYAVRIKKCSKEALSEPPPKSTTPLTASAAGSLTLGLGLTSAKKGSLTGGLGAGSLTGGVRAKGPLSSGLLGGFGGKALTGKAKTEESKADAAEDEEEEEGVEWGRIVSLRERFGFMQRLGSHDKQDIFFRAADVVAMGGNDPGDASHGLEIVLPHGRNSQGYTKFYLNLDDEVSFIMSKDNTGKTCAVDIRKEKKGAWRTGRRTQLATKNWAVRQETIKDQLNRLLDMTPDQVLHNVSLFKEILESPQFDASQHLNKLVSLLAAQELVEDDRADPLYRIFSDSLAMQTMLRTSIIRFSSGMHSGNFLEDCLRCISEIVIRHPKPTELRGQLPLRELVEAFEASVREGSSFTKGGLSEDVKGLLRGLQKKMPDEVNLDRVFGVRAKKQVVTAAEEYTELLEAEHYQDMPILPTSAEMLGLCAFEIQANMRTYERCEDFLQTHFMLLREDYIEPLREGIKLFFKGKHSPKDLHVYKEVKVVGMLSTMEGIVYRIELPRSSIRNINWEKSKQLMYGSLLCFSDDGFESLIWATVWRRDADKMASDGQLDVRLPLETFDDRFAPGKTFYCIENVTIYFEAYRHVLNALQSMRPSDVPFQSILLSPQPEAIAPGFLRADNDMFHFHSVFESCEKQDSLVSAPKSFKVLQEWPSTLLESLDIDPSQLDAIQHALTHAVALIQGPPGTGKTWVGLKIVRALLENTDTMRYSPILVVCYTNHALDQFLEGIFKFCEKIVRIGSRSKSEVMKNRNLKELVNELTPSKEYYQARKSLNDRRDRLREEFGKLTDAVNSHTVGLKWAREHLSEQQFEAFYQGYLDYLAEDAMKVTSVYESADAVDDELWAKMMKAWVDTSRPEKFAPVAQQTAAGLPAVKTPKDEEEDEIDRKTKEIANDAEEDEAEAEQEQRKLDVEAAPGDAKEDGQAKRPGGDFFAPLPNAWLAYPEDVPVGTNWREHANELWSIPLSKRKDTYRQWLLAQHHEARQELPEISLLLERNAESRAALERDRKLELLREMKIVGMTTTAVSKYQTLLKELRPEVVIVEEAAEVLEAHILTALHPRTQHIILIGDHQQLRPSTAVYRLSTCFKLDVSLFERLIKNGADHVTLLQQRRMHPKISRLIKPLYPKLRDHDSTYERAKVMGVDCRTFFLRHNKFEDDEGESHSKSNSFEAAYIAALCGHLVRSGYEESQITVLTPYLGQVRTLKNKIKRDPDLQNVLITAVDNYQGEENDIIVISLVRSNRQKAMGFLAVDNRINVALTRARCGMFIVGNADMLSGHKLWSSILRELQSDNSFGSVMPLLDQGGKVVDVSTADEILSLTDSGHVPSDAADRSPVVAERWAALGSEDRGGRNGGGRGNDGRGGRGDRGYDDRGGRGGGDRGYDDRGGRGGGDRGYDDRGARPKQPAGRGQDGEDGGQDSGLRGGKKKNKNGGQVLMKFG